jgi:hypothetical protein
VLASRSAAGDLAGSSSRREDQAAYSSSGTAPCRVGRRGGTPRPPPSARSCAVGRHRRCTYVSKHGTTQPQEYAAIAAAGNRADLSPTAYVGVAALAAASGTEAPGSPVRESPGYQ